MLPRSLARIPRCRLARTPTPIVKTPLSFGDRALYVKRDDLTGCALTGNKVRKLEYLIADARRCGADTLLTCGGVQSNCARALAVAAAMTGFRSVLILTGRAAGNPEGNFLLDRLVGAEIETLPDADASERDAVLEQRAAELRSQGRVPYVVPFGGSSEVGALGYVRAAIEIARQLGPAADRIDRVVVPVASGGTIAGLYVGFKMLGLRLRLTGMFVEQTCGDWADAIATLATGTADRFGFSITPPIEGEDIDFVDARGAGYGKPSDSELRFIASVAQKTGLLTDPVYTGKALFAFDRAVCCGDLALRGDVLFVHTGGLFGLFPFGDRFAAVLDETEQVASAPARRLQRPVRIAPPSPSTQRISIASP